MSVVEAYKSYCAENSLEIDSGILRVLDVIQQKSILSPDSTSSIVINKSSGTQIDDAAFGILLESIESVAGQIVQFQMRYQRITDESIMILVKKCSKFAKLASLDFQCCEIGGSSMKALSQMITVSNLQSLVLSGNRLSSSSGVELGRSISNSKIEILELADCGLSADALIAIFSSIQRPSCILKKLDVSGCQPLGPQQEIAYHIEDALKLNPKIERLHLRKVGLRDSGVERIAFGVRFTNNLKYLDLGANKLSRDSASILSVIINKIDTLDLSHNRIQSEGAMNLAESITSGEKSGLRVLGLTNADIDDSGICALLEAYKNPNSNLETILLWGNRFEQKSSELLTSLMKSGKLSEKNSDCRGNCGWHPDGTSRPAELSHHLRQFYWWTPTKGPEEQRASLQQPGVM